MVEVMATGMGANSKKPRETGRAFPTPSHAGVVFPAPRVPTPLQTLSCNCATVQPLRRPPQLHGCVVAAERGEGHSTPDVPDTPLHRTPLGLK